MMFAAYRFVVQFVEIKSNARWNQELICSQKGRCHANRPGNREGVLERRLRRQGRRRASTPP
jgi:hypothetical protein